MFVIDDTAVPVDYITIDTQSVLIEVSSVGADYVAAFDVVGAANTVLIHNRDYETLPHHADPHGPRRVPRARPGRRQRTVSEVAAASHLEEVTVISILGKFCHARCCSRAGERGPAADDADWRPSRQRADEVVAWPLGAHIGAAARHRLGDDGSCTTRAACQRPPVRRRRDPARGRGLEGEAAPTTVL